MQCKHSFRSSAWHQQESGGPCRGQGNPVNHRRWCGKCYRWWCSSFLHLGSRRANSLPDKPVISITALATVDVENFHTLFCRRAVRLSPRGEPGIYAAVAPSMNKNPAFYPKLTGTGPFYCFLDRFCLFLLVLYFNRWEQINLKKKKIKIWHWRELFWLSALLASPSVWKGKRSFDCCQNVR